KCKRKKYKRKIQASKAPQGTSIEKRAVEILLRNTFGHWEMDCVVGTTLRTLLVLTERLTRKEIIIPIPNKKAVSVVTALNKLERKYGKLFKRIFKTITVDNGVEFSDSEGIEKSIYGNKKRTTVYYCHPYSSYERGTNERLNREIRRKLPKGTNFNKVSDKEVKAVEDWVNNYPKAVLGYATANEVFEKYISAL
ncbi:MAG TPA: IS30 family transposase, partial [Clostridiales bacterium]|nr:IS30 family transposase [Clostridiales bacterium]